MMFGVLLLKDLLVSCEEVSHIIRRFPDLGAGLSAEQRALTATSWFLASAYPELGSEFAALMERICEAEELCRETNGMAEGFARVMNDWQRDSDFTDVYEVNEIIEDLDAVRERGILYTGEHFYLPEKLFCSIVRPLIREGIPILALKNALREQKLLLSDRNRNSYTVKISVMNEYVSSCPVLSTQNTNHAGSIHPKLNLSGRLFLFSICSHYSENYHSLTVFRLIPY